MSDEAKFKTHGPHIDRDRRELTWTAMVATGQLEADEVVITVRYPMANTAWSEAAIRHCAEEAKDMLIDVAEEIAKGFTGHTEEN